MMTTTEASGPLFDLIRSQLHVVLDAIIDVVCILDRDMRIIAVNQAALHLLQIQNPSSLAGQPCFAVFAGNDSACDACPAHLASLTGQPQRVEIECQHLGRSLLVSVVPLLNEGELIGYVHVARDMSQQHRLEKQLVQAQKMEAIATLAGGIAHDFNNILGAILGNVDLLLYRFRQQEQDGAGAVTPEELQETLEEVRRAGRRAAELVQQVLAFSRQGRSQKQSLMAGPVVKEAVKLLRSSLPTTIEIHLSIAQELEQIQADPGQVHQVLMNLCTNAAHAMRSNGGRLDITLRMVQADETLCLIVPELRPGRYVAMSVADSGHGMSPEVIERIFDPFFTTKEVGEGTGLGLSVIHGIVVDHGGAIQVQSTLAAGSTFTVYWPGTATVIDAVNERQAWVLEGGNERILFVDDEEEIVRVRKRMLEYLGYHVDTATNGHEALQCFLAAPDKFDLLITDQTMPLITGIELARAVHAKRPDLPIILCSGYSAAVSDEEARAQGISRFLRKPIEMRDMARSIHDVLHQRYRGQQK